MKKEISNLCNDEELLKELGSRIKAERIRQKMTQAQFALNVGVGKSTIERAESGESIQFINIIKILRALHQLATLDVLLPSSEMTPMQYIYSKTQKQPKRYYASGKKDKDIIDFVWGEDQKNTSN